MKRRIRIGIIFLLSALALGMCLNGCSDDSVQGEVFTLKGDTV